MKKFEWLNDYTLDSVSWTECPPRFRIQQGGTAYTFTRQEVEDIYPHMGAFLQDTDRAND